MKYVGEFRKSRHLYHFSWWCFVRISVDVSVLSITSCIRFSKVLHKICLCLLSFTFLDGLKFSASTLAQSLEFGLQIIIYLLHRFASTCPVPICQHHSLIRILHWLFCLHVHLQLCLTLTRFRNMECVTDIWILINLRNGSFNSNIS